MCLVESNDFAVCSLDPQEIYTIAVIYENYWSHDEYQGAGTIGLGFGNTTALTNMTKGTYDGFNMQLSNFTDLSFAQANYTPYTNESSITLSSSKPSDRNTMQLPIP